MKLRQLFKPDFRAHHVASRLSLAAVLGFCLMGSSGVTASASRPFLYYNGKQASAPSHLPYPVHKVVEAANSLQSKPYRWGGGHKYLYDRGYDCSGSVSFVLYMAGLLRGPMTSSAFKDYGEPGPGRYITIFAADGHVFISVCGLRFDTSDWGAGRGEGPRWRPKSRKLGSGYEMRHPPGL